MNNNAPRGLTMMEGLIAGGIIAILLLATGVMVSSARERARDYKRLADITRIQASLELYFNDVNSYPVTEDGAIALGSQGATCLSRSGLQQACSSTGQVYLNPIPSQTDIGLKGGELSVYTYESDGDSYVVGFVIERAIPQANVARGLVCARPGQTIKPSSGTTCTL
jgi:Tfp pilus assembly protein PilE